MTRLWLGLAVLALALNQASAGPIDLQEEETYSEETEFWEGGPGEEGIPEETWDGSWEDEEVWDGTWKDSGETEMPPDWEYPNENGEFPPYYEVFPDYEGGEEILSMTGMPDDVTTTSHNPEPASLILAGLGGLGLLGARWRKRR